MLMDPCVSLDTLIRAIYAGKRLLSGKHDGKQDDMTCIEDTVSFWIRRTHGAEQNDLHPIKSAAHHLGMIWRSE